MKITEEHIKLLAGMAELMTGDDDSYGYVPTFNSKRPFGNSGNYGVGRDAAEILDLDLPEDDEDLCENNRQYALQVLYECTPVLKAILGSSDVHGLVGMDVPE